MTNAFFNALTQKIQKSPVAATTSAPTRYSFLNALTPKPQKSPVAATTPPVAATTSAPTTAATATVTAATPTPASAVATTPAPALPSATQKITKNQVLTLDLGSLLSVRDAAQSVVATASPKSQEYKNAAANLGLLNGELAKDLSVSGSVSKQLTSIQALSIANAANNNQTTVELNGASAQLQKAVNSALAANERRDAGKDRQQENYFNQGVNGLYLDEIEAIKVFGRKAGLSAQQIQELVDTETAANNAERLKIREEQLKPGAQTFGSESGSFRSSMTFADALPEAARVLNAGYDVFDKFNIPLAYRSGKTIVGLENYAYGDNLGSGVLDAGFASLAGTNGKFAYVPDIGRGDTSPKTGPALVSALNSIQTRSGRDVLTSNAKLIDGGVDPQGRPYEIYSDLIQYREKGPVTGLFVKYPDGNVDLLSASPQITPTGGDFWSRYGGLILGVASGFALGPLANIFGGGAATLGSTIAAGAALGAGTAALTGGDILTGGLLGGLGGGFSSYVGSYGGLGSYLARNGLNISPDTIGLLNNIVPGISGAPAPVTDLSTSLLDDAVNAVNAGAAAGLLDDATAATLKTGIGNFRLTPNQIEDFIPTPTGGGTLPSIPTPVPGSGISSGIGMGGMGAGINPNAGGIGFNINPEDFIPTPVGGGTLPPPSSVNLNIDSRIPPPIGAGTIPTVSSPNVSQPSLLDDALGAGRSVVDDAINFVRENPLTSAAVAATVIDAINREPVPTGVGDNRLPAWVFDPAMSGVIPRIRAAQAAVPAPMPNLFNAQFQRGGLGAGQFIGYDLLNRTGDIPQQTLLGVSPLAMPPLNLLGVTGGQTPTSQTALV